MGTHYYGDNFDILRRYLKDKTVDLVISIRLQLSAELQRLPSESRDLT